MKKLFAFVFVLLFAFVGFSQTKGLIYKPANAGKSVLDPNLDGYISKTNQGFMVDDETESEIPFVPLPVIGAGEPSSDNSAGPSCGFVDLVRSADDETIYTYSDGTNLFFRFRLGGTAENSKGYTILVDTDQLFGNGSDPDYVAGNPGFEYEITLRTNFGVSIYDIDNNTLTSTEIGDGTVDRPYDDFAQKAIAGSVICGTDYFYDFYIPYADLPYSSSTPVRMVGGTIIAPKNSTGFKMADLGGVDDDAGITDDLFQSLIDVFPPTSGDDISSGTKISPRAACPSITGPIVIGITSISGTTSEVDGATIEVFRGGVSQGTTLASGGNWILSGIAATADSEVFTATAKVSATAAAATSSKEKSTSYSICNSTTVGATCSNSPTGLNSTGSSGKTISGNSGLTTETYTVRIYGSDGTTLFPNKDLQPLGDGDSSPYPFTGQTGATFVWEYDGSSALPDGVYYTSITETSPNAKCESLPTIFCKGIVGSATPTITTSPIATNTASITGFATTGAVVELYIDGVATGTTEPASGSLYTIALPAVTVGQSISVYSRETGNCPTQSSATLVTSAPVQSAAPTIEGEYCGATTSISGVTASGSGTTIQIYKAAVTGGPYTTTGSSIVTTGSSWTVSGLSIAVGEFVVAKATGSGETESNFSNEIEIFSQTTDGALSITNPVSPNEIRVGDVSISGTGTPGNTVFLYLDGFIVDELTYFDMVDGSGDWTITGLDKATAGYDVLYAEAVVTVTSKSGALCESNQSAGETVLCKLPDNSMVFSPTSATTICAGETVSFSVSTSESLVVYELVDQVGNGVGPASLGNGNALSLTTYAIDASVTSISLIASRIGITCEQTVGVIAVSPEEINLTHVITQQPNNCLLPDGIITLSGLNNNQTYTLDYKVDGIAATTTTPTANISGEIAIGSLGPGEYTDITVTGTAITLTCGNIIAGPVVLTNLASPVLTLGVVTIPNTCGAATGSIALTSSLTGSILTYDINYLLDGTPTTQSETGDLSGNIVFGSLSAGVYTNISITPVSTGCKSNSVGPVTIGDPDPTITISGSSNPSVCGGNGNINLTFTGFTDGTYTINYDGGSFAGVSVVANAATISAPAGSYVNLSATESTTGCLTNEDPDVTLLDPATHTIAASRINPSSCGGNGSINLIFTGVPDNTYTVNYDGGSFSGVVVSTNSATITAPAGTYNNLSLTLAGCVSAEYPDVTLTNPVLPVVSLTSSTSPSTVGGSDGSIILGVSVANGTYSFDYHDGTNPQVFAGITVASNSATISGLSEGSYNDISITVNSCTSTSNIDVVLTDPLPAAPTIASSTPTNPSICGGLDGSIALTFTNVPDGTYTLDYQDTAPSAQTFTGVVVSSNAATISGLSSGVYNDITITVSAQTSTENIDITLSDPTPATITLGTLTDPTTCSGTDGSIQLMGLANSTTYTVNYTDGGGAKSGSFISNGAGLLLITGLAADGYTNISVTESSCTSNILTGPATLNDPANPATPTVGTITQPTCAVATASVALSGLPASGSWTVTESVGSTTITGTGTTATFSGLADNQTYTFTVANADGCTSVASGNAVVNAQPVTPATPTVGTITQPTCAVATASVALSGLPASGSWTVTESVGSTTTTGTGTTTTFSGLAANQTYTFTVTNADGCTSVASGNAVVNAQPVTPTTPTVGTITQPTCAVATASVALSGLPASGSWTVTESVGGTTTTGTGTTTTFSGLAANQTYTFTVTNADGCTSVASGNAVVNAQPVTPATPTVGTITQPTCAVATANVALSGLPASGSWTVTESVGGTTTTGTGTTTTFSGLAANQTYTFTVTNADGCTSVASGNAVVNAQPTPPTITLGTSPSVVQGTTSADLPYTSTTNSPNQYTIDFDATAQGQGFVNVSVTTLPTTPISIVVPGTAAIQTYNATVTVINSSTGCSSSPVAFTVTVTAADITPPTIDIQGAPSIVNSTSGYTVTFEFSEDVSGFDLGDILVDKGGAGTFIIVDGNTYTAVITPDGTGDITIDVAGSAAQDLAGNNSTAATQVVTTYDDIPPATPTVDPLSTTDTTPVLTGTARASTVTVVINGVTFTTIATAGGIWSVDTGTDVPTAGGPFTALADGDYNVAATSTDAAGNSTAETVVDELTVDTAAPATPTVDPLSTTDTTPVLTGTAEPGSTVTVVINGVTFTTIATAGGIWSVDTGTDVPTAGGPFTALADGDYNVVATSTDAAGNSTAETVVDELTIDTAAPATPTVDPLSTTDTTPVLTGTAEPGSTVTVVINGVTFTTTATAGGIWSVDTGTDVPTAGGPFTALADGDYNVAATSTDAAGNSTAETVVDELTIDTAAPATPTVDPLSTTDTTPVLTGTAEPGSTVTVVINGVTFTTIATAGGIWSVDTGTDVPTAGGPFTALADGDYNVAATSTDAAGNSTAETVVDELTVDTAAPATPTVDPLSTTDTTPVLTGTAEPGSTVTVVINGVTFTTIATAGGIWSVDTGTDVPTAGGPFTALADGDYNVVATSTDAAGNSTAETVVDELTIDTAAPATPTVDPLSTTDTTPVLTGTAEPGSTVTVVINGVTFTTTATAGGIWSVDTGTDVPTAGGPFTALADGDYNVAATSTDAAGNSTAETVVDELTIDTAAPATPTVDPLSTTDTTPVLTGTAEPGSTVTVVINGVTFTTIATAGGIWSVDTGTDVPTAGGPFTALADGDYNVAATSTDAAGNSTAETVVDELTIDTAAPATPTVDPLSTTDTTPVLTGTAEPGSTVTVVINGVTFTTIATAGGIWSVDTGTDVPTAGGPFTALADGDYNVVATSTDAAGNSTAETVVDELTIDTAAPATPTVDPLSTTDTTPVLTGTAEPGSTVTVVINGVTFTTTATAGGIWSVDTGTDVPTAGGPFTALADGDYNVAATSTDAAGNSTAETVVDELTIDTAAPATPTVDPLSTTDTTPVLTGTAEPGSTVTVVINGVTFTTIATAGGIWSVDTGTDVPTAGGPFTALADGDYNVAATSTDAAGNSTAETVVDELTIDTAAPATPTVDPLSTTDTTPVLTGTAEPGSTVTVVINGVTFTTIATAGGIWSVNTGTDVPTAGGPFTALTDGDYNVAATSTDAAGNSTAETVVDELTIDTAAPATPTVDPLITTDTTPVLTGTAEPGSTVTVVINGVTFTTIATAGGIWSVDTGTDVPTAGGPFTALADGDYNVVATSTDAAGNSTSETVVDELTIDTIAPATPTVDPLSTTDTTPVLTGTAEPGSTVTVVINGVTFTTTATAGGIWSVDTGTDVPTAGGPFTALTDGDYNVAATSTDAAGNSTAETVVDELTVDTIAPATPTVDPLSTTDTTPVLTGTAEPGSTVTVVINGVTFTTIATAGGIWSVDTGTDVPTAGGPFTALTDGDYNVAATSTDAAGNSTAETVVDELTIDTAAPATPTVDPLSTTDTTPVLTGTAEPGSTVTVVINGVTFTTTATAGGIWSVDTRTDIPTAGGPFTALADGDYNVAATSTDAAGNSTAETAVDELTIDTIAPVAPTVSSQIINDTTPTITGTTGTGAALAAGETLTVVVNGATYTVIPDASENWSIDTGAASPSSGTLGTFSDGNTYQVVATITDNAGNAATDISTNELNIDTTPPITPTVASQTTNDATPTLTGTAETGSTITVVVGGATYVVIADGSGNWSIDTGALTPTSGVFAPNVSGANEVIVTSTDAAGNSSTDTTSGELIINQNDAPVATTENITTDEDVDFSGTLLDNVSDVDGDNLSFTLITTLNVATEGVFTLNVDGTYTFVPADNFFGSLTLTYEVCDDGSPAICVQETINITVNPINDFPIATGESLTIDEGTSGNGTLVDNVTDAEGDNLIFSLISGPNQTTEGTAAVNTDGTYSFVPVSGFNGTLTFTYEVCDDGMPSRCSQATVTIMVNSVNDAPVALDDIAGVDPGSSVAINVLGNDSDPEGNNLTVSGIASNPTNGTVVINADGTVTYTPNAGFENGTDTFTYEVCDDGSPSACSTAVVTVYVPSQEFAPTAVDDVATVNEDGNVSGNVLNNDSDGNADNLTVNTTPVSGPANGTLVLNADGTYTYTPNPDFSGTDSFTYEVCDDSTPPLCSQATVTITVNAVNDAPIASGETLTVNEDTSDGGTLADNASDVEGDNLTFSLVSGPNPSTEGTVTVNPDGTYMFVPVAEFNGTVSFTYEVCDDGSPVGCSQASVTIVVVPTNDAPIANDDQASVDPGNSVSIKVLANDTDPEGDKLTVSSIASNPGNGLVVINGDGTITYTPNPGFTSGTDTFTYEVCDDGTPSLCTTGTVTVTVPKQALAPVAIDDAITVNEDESQSGNVLSNDSDGNGDLLTVNTTPVSGPSNGTLVLNSDGTFTYTPNPGFNGTDNFIYEVCDDGIPLQCDQATVNLTVNPVNDAPIATPESITTDEDMSVTGTLTDNADDEDSGSLSFSLITTLNPTSEGVFALNSDGTYTFIPVENFAGVLTLTYEVCDDANPALCVQETITITVNPVNDAPIGMDSTIVQEGFDPIIGSLAGLVSDPDGDPLSFSLASGPSNGTLSLNPDGTFTFAPESGFTGTVTFTYSACDNITPPACTQATITITITATDTDGDGVLDKDEDTDGDGNLENDDCDEDGTPNYLDTDPCDTDGDGINDDDEDSDGNGDPYNDDCDGDNLPNFQDSDACDTDGDGIADNDEDTDGDGDPYNDDCDEDDIPNFQDPDSCDTDNDGIVDDDEDTDGDGDPYNDDCDEDGLPNFLDTDPCDTDGDGIADDDEDTNGDGNPYNDDCDSDGVPNFKDPDPCTTVDPMGGFTPDGNGENDFFYIKDIENFPNNVVQVYNRWGNKLFEVNGYDNRDNVWRGESKFGLVLGPKEVPSGTYFYLIDLGNGSKPLSGFVVIKR